MRVLIGSQILGGVGSSTGFSLSTLLAKEITGNAGLAGLTGTFSSLGAACATIPLSRIMAARGSRPGLVLGYCAAIVGTLVIVLAARLHFYPLLLGGMALFGCASAVNLQARYAGTDLAPAERRGRSLSMVIWAVTVGSILGPEPRPSGGGDGAGPRAAAAGRGVPVVGVRALRCRARARTVAAS